MRRFYVKYLMKNVSFHVLTAIAVILIVASWFVPPMGIIDGSVLAAVGEIFGFASLGTVIKAIDKGIDATITKGDTSMTIGDRKLEKEE